MEFEWDEGKSEKLKSERGVSLEELAEAIRRGGLLDEIDNPGHAGQKILVVRHAGEVWAVPMERRGTAIRFITAFPNRKLRKHYEKA